MLSAIGSQSVTTHGETYTTDEDNLIVVPRDFADDLLSHNFEYVGIKGSDSDPTPVVEETTETSVDTGTGIPGGTTENELPVIPLGTKPVDVAETNVGETATAEPATETTTTAE
jgi:hypothetical protein